MHAKSKTIKEVTITNYRGGPWDASENYALTHLKISDETVENFFQPKLGPSVWKKCNGAVLNLLKRTCCLGVLLHLKVASEEHAPFLSPKPAKALSLFWKLRLT